MKVLVIPDVHLKSWMFERAEEIMKKGMVKLEEKSPSRSPNVRANVSLLSLPFLSKHGRH